MLVLIFVGSVVRDRFDLHHILFGDLVLHPSGYGRLTEAEEGFLELLVLSVIEEPEGPSP